MKDLKNRLDLLEMDLKKLAKKIKEEGTCGTEEDWHHVLQRVRKIEEFAIAQLAIKKYLEERTSST
ncbi:MAG: hypothetical protein Q7J76_09675 [Candidatus Brocadiaceae bacterium]|uniref:hypothetical protein n=1 Tax=Candidatus Wunengus sp. YC61 TaxID=3367698 RepID=UPI002715DFE5|nr:hypothetical protein [Candidatus Brocadiaceae bacterium]